MLLELFKGLETVALRMKQHCSNAQKVVEFLTKHKEVERVIYPNQHKGEIGDRAKKYLNGGNGGLVGIELKVVLKLVKNLLKL